MAQRLPARLSKSLRQLPSIASSPGSWRQLSSTVDPSSAASFSDDQIAHLSSQSLHRLTLSDLVKHGQPPLSTVSLLASANFTSSLIPIRLAHRVRALRNLPFIVVSNPHISKIYATYLNSLETLLPFFERSIASIDEEARFTSALADLVQSHTNTIPVLARGFLECRRYIAPDAVTRFLEEHLRARIGTRLIAEQHIALHLASTPERSDHEEKSSNSSSSSQSESLPPPDSYIGVIDTALRPASVLANCEAFVADLCEYKYGVRPSVVVDGAPGIRFAHIPTHLEYILTELLKNAFRATVESGREREPIEVTIAMNAGADEEEGNNLSEGSRGGDGMHQQQSSSPPPSLLGEGSGSGWKTGGGACAPGDETLTIRIRDRGGGISPAHLPHIWGYSFTTFSEDATRNAESGAYQPIDALSAIAASGGEGSTIAGLGYGLPLSRAYAEYFGGGIQLQSLWGWGTDVYLRLKGLKGF